MDAKKREELSQEAKKFFEANKPNIIGDSTNEQQNVVKFSLKILAEFSPELSEEILNNPIDTINLLEDVLAQSGLKSNPCIRLIDLPEFVRIRLRDIRARSLDLLTFIDVILQRKSEISPSYNRAKFECPTCSALIVLQIDNKFHEPSRCNCGRKRDFKVLSREISDTIDIHCRDVRSEERQRVDLKKFTLFGGDLVSKIDDIPEGSHIRIIGIPLIRKTDGQGKSALIYSFNVIG